MTTEAGLEKVFAEVKRMRQELKSIEASLDSLLESLIPEGEEISPQEAKELKEAQAEME